MGCVSRKRASQHVPWLLRGELDKAQRGGPPKTINIPGALTSMSALPPITMATAYCSRSNASHGGHERCVAGLSGIWLEVEERSGSSGAGVGVSSSKSNYGCGETLCCHRPQNSPANSVV